MLATATKNKTKSLLFWNLHFREERHRIMNKYPYLVMKSNLVLPSSALIPLTLFKNLWWILMTYKIKCKILCLAFKFLHNIPNNLMVIISSMRVLDIEVVTYYFTDGPHVNGSSFLSRYTYLREDTEYYSILYSFQD